MVMQTHLVKYTIESIDYHLCIIIKISLVFVNWLNVNVIKFQQKYNLYIFALNLPLCIFEKPLIINFGESVKF